MIKALVLLKDAVDATLDIEAKLSRTPYRAYGAQRRLNRAHRRYYRLARDRVLSAWHGGATHAETRATVAAAYAARGRYYS